MYFYIHMVAINKMSVPVVLFVSHLKQTPNYQFYHYNYITIVLLVSTSKAGKNTAYK